jgi:putative transposase
VEVPWSLPALRREWNAVKGCAGAVVGGELKGSPPAPGLTRSLGRWARTRDSHAGCRAGRRVGCPRFKRRGRGRVSCRFMTGALGVSGRTRVRLARIGHVRTHEPAVKVLSRLKNGSARVLSATVSWQAGRWYCSMTVQVARTDAGATQPDAVVGVDVGVRHLAVLFTRPDDRVENPRALSARAAPAASLPAAPGSSASRGQSRPVTARMRPRSQAAGPHDALAVSGRPSTSEPGFTPGLGTSAATRSTR